MKYNYAISLLPCVRFDGQPDTPQTGEPLYRMRLEGLEHTVARAFKKMADAPVLQGDLERDLEQGGEIAGIATFIYHLDRLQEKGLICYGYQPDDETVVILNPNSERFRLQDFDDLPDQRFQLSRFVNIQRHGSRLVLTSPLAHAQLTITDERIWQMLFHLTVPTSPAEMERALPAGWDAAPLINLLRNAHTLTAVDKTGTSAEDQDQTLRQWEAHDLLFHTRSRLGRHRNPFGGTFPFRSEIEPQPAIKPIPQENRTILTEKENLTLDMDLETILTKRKSTRQFGSRPISRETLSTFLTKTAKVWARREVEGLQLSHRPYPAGGASYELELYPLINSCDGLKRGLYHYCPLDHVLTLIAPWNRHVHTLLDDARAVSTATDPQVLIIVASRFQRVSWKYRSMAYALILKDLGILYQNMYLVATAMGLGACALGGGNADLFAETASTDYLQETSVGEFLLGTLPD